MSKRLGLIIGSIAAFFILCIGLFIVYYNMTFMERLDKLKMECIFTSISPNSEYTFNAYLSNGGATVDYAVIGEIVNNKTKEKKNIYFEYHRASCKAEWLGNYKIIINGNIIEDIRKDYYNYKKDPLFEKKYQERVDEGEYD